MSRLHPKYFSIMYHCKANKHRQNWEENKKSLHINEFNKKTRIDFSLTIASDELFDIHMHLIMLQFRNGPSFVHANQSFNWQMFCGLHFEPESMCTIRLGWDVLELISYLFQNRTNQRTCSHLQWVCTVPFH